MHFYCRIIKHLVTWFLLSCYLLSSGYGVGFLAIRSLWSLENGQLGIYDLAINALASVCAAKKPDQEFTTIKINEGRSFGNWQITGNFSQILSKSLRGFFVLYRAETGKEELIKVTRVFWWPQVSWKKLVVMLYVVLTSTTMLGRELGS